MRLCRFTFSCASLVLLLAGPRGFAQVVGTTTVLSITTTGGVPTGSVPAHTVVTLTAAVSSIGTAVSPGQVQFCDATATFCTGTHLLGSAQIQASGNALYRFTPSPGIHSYKAVFVGTHLHAASTSIPVSLVVLDGASGVSAVGVQASGSQGDYDLLGTVVPGGGVSPSGQVSFLDTSNANYQLGVATLSPTGASNTSFRQSYSFQFPLGTGARPGQVVTGDFNNDGHQDVLFVSGNLGAVYTLLGKGDGTFNTLQFPAVVNPTEPPLVADLNSDGNLDFVVRTPTGLAVYLGRGDGTFTSGITISVQHLAAFVIADVNNDGIPDLLVADGGSGILYAYLGDGTGFFAAPKIAFSGIIAVVLELTADFNGDGNVDVLLENSGSQLLLGNGDGTFRTGPPPPAFGPSVEAGVVGDLNADGRPDVVLASSYGAQATVALGNGDGTFNLLPSNPQITSASNAVALADFNGDGILDAVFPYLFGGQTNVYIGKGDGTFTPDIYSPGLADFVSESLSTADFNGDGQTDIAEAFQGDDFNQVVVLLSQSASTSAGYARNISPVGTGYHYVDAFYPGDSNTPAGTSQTLALLAQQVPTNLSLIATPAAGSVYGQSVTLTASLDQYFAQNHSASGLVTFTSNGTTLGTAQVTNGVATLVTSAIPAGSDSLQAIYAGDTNFAPSTSAALIFSVAKAQQTITLTVPNSNNYAGVTLRFGYNSTSGLPVTYSVVSGPATILPNIVPVPGLPVAYIHYTGTGTVVVQGDQPGDSNYAAAPPVQQTINVTFLTVPVGSSASVITYIPIVTPGQPASLVGLTQGAPNLDFQGIPGYNCRHPSPYVVGEICAASFTFAPTEPGIRDGVIRLLDAAGNVLGTDYIYGIGVGPQVNWTPGTLRTLVTGVNRPVGLAVDGLGNVFYTAEYKGGLMELKAGSSTPVVLNSNFGATLGIALDGNGNLFVSNTNGTTVSELLASSGYATVVTLVSNLSSPAGLAVDGNGNLFIADSGNFRVVELTASSGYTQMLNLPLTVFQVQGLALDYLGNLFLTTTSSIIEATAASGYSNTVTLMTGLIHASLATDSNANLYVADANTRTVVELTAASSYAKQIVLINMPLSGISAFVSVAVDGRGNVYANNFSQGIVYELDVVTPPSLSFAATPVGSTSTDSPQSVTFVNNGNAPLNFFSSSAANPSSTAAFSFTSTCPIIPAGSSITFAVAPGANCTDAVSFTPVTLGTNSGQLTTTDNNLNVAGAIQIVPLNGVGTAPVPTINFTVPNHTFGDAPFTVSATSNSSGAISYSVISGPATIMGSMVTLTGAGSVTLLASQAASGAYSAGSQTATFAVGKQSQTITFPSPASPVNFGIAPISLTATASSGLPVVFSVLSGPGSLNGNVLTLTAAGTVVIAADQSGDPNFSAALEVTRSIVVIGRLANINLTATPNPVFLQNPLSLIATVSSASGVPTGTVTFLDGPLPLGSAILNGGTVPLITSALTLGTHSITAAYSGDGNYAAFVSSAVVVVVQDFAFTATNPQVTISHGGTAVYSLVLSSVGGSGLASTVNFSTSGAPEYSQITFTPASVATGSGTTPVTLTIHTPNYPSGPFNGSIRSGTSTTSLAFIALGGLVLACRKKRATTQGRTRLLNCAILLGTAAASLGFSGCGSGWRTQHFTIQVTASSGGLSRSAKVYLTSQCKNQEASCPVE